MIEILNRYTKAVLFSSATATDIAAAVIEAVKARANLREANLWRAKIKARFDVWSPAKNSSTSELFSAAKKPRKRQQPSVGQENLSAGEKAG